MHCGCRKRNQSAVPAETTHSQVCLVLTSRRERLQVCPLLLLETLWCLLELEVLVLAPSHALPSAHLACEVGRAGEETPRAGRDGLFRVRVEEGDEEEGEVVLVGKSAAVSGRG